MLKVLKTILNFYSEGFRNLTPTSRKLWFLILVKTVVMLLVLNMFFPDILGQFDTQEEKIDAVSNSLLNTD